MSAANRLPTAPGERIDRGRTVRFTFDGATVEGLEGDTIGSALFAAGRRTFSRSFKYHRRRGLLCVAGQCPNCICAVDGAPGARACVEPIREGMTVEHVNARPSLEHDAMRITDVAGGPFTPPGFYYKTFMRPRRLWPLYEKLLRNAAGLGRLRARQPEREWRTEYRRRHADVLVVGGGAAGLRAAITAARGGADTVLVDEGPALGGRRLLDPDPGPLRALVAEAVDAGVELLDRGTALGCFDGLVPVWRGDTLHQVRAAHIVIASGTIEQPLVFAGNDLPGVMLSGGARRLATLYGVAPGRRAVVVTTSDRGLEAAAELRRRGVEIVAVADLRPQLGPAAQQLAVSGIPVFAGHTAVQATGAAQVESVEIAPVATPDAPGSRFPCDLLVVSGGAIPASSLALQAGARTVYDEARGHFALAELPEGFSGAGEVMGVTDPAAIEASGELAGLAALSALGREAGDAGHAAAGPARRDQLQAALAAVPAPVVAVAPPVSGAARGKCFACLCEDVTAKDIHLSIEEGYDSIELSKRYTTVTMGPCQGRMCQLPAVRAMAQETGQSLGDVGTTTARPPWVSVPMGILAGPTLEPAKRSSIHARHRALGANVQWAGDWRRAYDYGDVEAEAMAVHQAAGLIDVSTLGKLLVRGAGAGDFLDRLYPNRISTLQPGRIRYGVINSDAGRIMDDGTICRVDDDSFYVTTTSSGAGAVEQWFTWWLADWGGDVAVTDLTQGMSAVNLAGPRAREILSAVCDGDCSAESFGYLDARQHRVAGVSCLIMRIGFVGELGYEIHFPSAYGPAVWDALTAAGEPHGLRPFGLEPQRILRLQKLHVIIGQDTDSESNLFTAGMGWMVKPDKPGDFIGRWALAHAADRTPEAALVGFTVADGAVPTEGAVVVDAGGRPAGQVTSSRHSPLLGRTIGMAWVPRELARDGQAISISDDGRRIPAEVRTTPFYDPEGEAQRS
jgi:sarcosine oxidase, subunit alpha